MGIFRIFKYAQAIAAILEYVQSESFKIAFDDFLDQFEDALPADVMQSVRQAINVPDDIGGDKD